MTSEKFSYKKTFIIGFGFLGISVIAPIFDSFVPIFLQAGRADFEVAGDITGFALTTGVAFFIMTWDNILNVFIQPWVGAKSDRTWNRFGRRKGWLLIGVPLAVIGFVFIPAAQSVLAIAIFILITNFGLSIFRSPTVAWLGDLFTPKQRSQANGIINLMGGVGAVLAFLIGGKLFQEYGRQTPFLFGAIIMLFAVAVVLIYVKEPREIDSTPKAPAKGSDVLNNFKELWQRPDKSGFYVLVAILLLFMGFNALQTGLSTFAVATLGLEAGLATQASSAVAISLILFAVPAGFIGGKIGRKKTMQIGMVGLSVLFVVGFVFIQNLTSFIIVLVIAGALWAMININSLPLVYDYGDEKKIGAYTGLYYFASQIAAIIGPLLIGFLIDAVNNNRIMWLFSAVFMALGWVAMQFVGNENKQGVSTQ